MRKTFFQDILLFVLFFLLCLLLFWPTLSKPFLSDDYEVLYRVVVQKQIFIKGFFRPLSDLSIYLCSLIGGLNPKVYNLFNLLVHAASCFVLYKLCLVSSLFPVEKRRFLAWTSSLLFLVYPFHLESVVWVVGRASGLSGFFGFLCLLTALSGLQAGLRLFLVCLFYFIGLASYETIFPLPLLLLIFLYEPKKPLKTYVPMTFCLALTLVLHLVLRVWQAQTFAGQYGHKIFSPSPLTYAVNAFKVSVRFFLPPSSHSILLAILFVIVAAGLLLASYRLLKPVKESRIIFTRLFLALLVSAIIPFMFGLSTHTTEGDRIVYFSSFFFVLWLSFLISLIGQAAVRYAAVGCVAIYFLVFLFVGNESWRKAGDITQNVLAQLSQLRRQHSSLGLLDMPDEYKGAFIFRVGFQQALLMNQIDTAGIVILRLMTSEESRAIHEAFLRKTSGDSLYLRPNSFLLPSLISVVQPETFDTIRYRRDLFEKLFYWNKKELVPLP